MKTENIKVWENDVYQWTNSAYLCECTGVVRYGEYLQDGSADEYPRIPCCGFYMEIAKIVPHTDAVLDAEDYPDYLKKTSVQEVFAKNENVKCVGNIFDNPELIK